MKFTYYALNLNHSEVVYRSEVHDFEVDILRALCAAGGGPIPSRAPWYLKISQRSGGWMFTVFRGKEEDAVFLCGVSQDPAFAPKIWEELEKVYLRVTEVIPEMILPGATVLVPILEMPSSTPWLGQVFLPDLWVCAQSDCDWFGRFMRCVVWALLDGAADGY